MSVKIPENTSKNTHNVVAQILLEEKELDNVLDIPSGSGSFTQRLLEKGINVHSGDIENIMMVENKNFNVADMNHTLPYDDNFFSAVVCIDGIEHLERPFDFIRECYRITKPGGRVIISTPNINALRSRWRWFWTSHHNKCKTPLNENKPTPLHHINMMSYQRMRYILHTSGFKINKVTTNRVKGISWLYMIFAPFSWLATKFVFGKEEKDPQQKKVNKEIVSDLFGKSLLFGETMILSARK
ncbi:class I SAM-dependent methyltransferase [Fulvivirga lutimaris]|uniref:class I SAM-dependent methyltransferase n=1 Tax=Fulvivirga lutimaris TaxID=1819566 RepID=UPI0012BBDDE9|nr:class I SAM-dependent methyltransferase [Fulvivirga lutimaris]MTI39515.1 class I SAM-dependent methyltransferase [Fulvivirga lutimaris]